MESIERKLFQIEKEANNDLQLLVDIGPQYFKTIDLQILLVKWAIKFGWYKKLQRLNMLLGISSPIFLILAFVLGIAGKPSLAIISLKLFPVVFVGFIIGAIALAWKYKSLGEMKYIGDSIQEELERRKDRPSSFHYMDN